MKLMTTKLKKAMVGISREIWWSNWETRRFDEKLGDSQENRESWQVWPHMLKRQEINNKDESGKWLEGNCDAYEL